MLSKEVFGMKIIVIYCYYFKNKINLNTPLITKTSGIHILSYLEVVLCSPCLESHPSFHQDHENQINLKC